MREAVIHDTRAGPPPPLTPRALSLLPPRGMVKRLVTAVQLPASWLPMPTVGLDDHGRVLHLPQIPDVLELVVFRYVEARKGRVDARMAQVAHVHAMDATEGRSFSFSSSSNDDEEVAVVVVVVVVVVVKEKKGE